MTVPFLQFTEQVPVLGTSLRLDQFDADSGWVIEPLLDGAVRLYRPANPSQNLPEIKPFTVHGVPYCVGERERAGRYTPSATEASRQDAREAYSYEGQASLLEPCTLCGSRDCPGAPRFKGTCNRAALAASAFSEAALSNTEVPAERIIAAADVAALAKRRTRKR